MLEDERDGSLDTLQDLLSEQTRNINELTKAIGSLAAALDQRPTKRDQVKYFIGMVVLLVAFTVGTIISTTTSTDDNRKVLNRLDDCLIEGGDCYEAQAERSAVLVVQLACQNERLVQRAFADNGMTFELSEQCL